MEQRNIAKAKLLYDFIDNSQLYVNKVDKACRSRMNVPFFLRGDDGHPLVDPTHPRNAAFLNAAKAAGLPTVSLAAAPAFQDIGGSSSHTSSIGVTLNVPLFTGFSTTYKVRNAEALKEAREAQRERIRQQVALDVWQSYQNLLTSGQSLQTTADLLNSAEAAEKVALGRYKAGVGSILDVLNAQSALALARQQRVQATFDWNVSRATLAQAMGNLDISLLQRLPDASASATAAPPSSASQPLNGASQPVSSGTPQGTN